MPKIRHYLNQRQKRQLRVRGKLNGTLIRPRLTVMRSNVHLSLQVINDEVGKTLLAVSDIGKSNQLKGTKIEKAVILAKNLSTQLKTKKINQLVFDRGYNKYHGRVKAVAQTLREEGIEI